MRFNDANEPVGTAGKPMLEVLLKNNLNNVLAVTIRYYGGIKLGFGGLIRAYSRSVRDALKLTTLTKVVNYQELKIIFPYNLTKDVDYILKDCIIQNQKYKTKVTYLVLVETEQVSLIREQLQLLNKVTIKMVNPK